MKRIDWQSQDAMPSDIAAIGEEFSRAIHADHRRRKARRSRVRHAIVVIAVVGVGSGTALAAQFAVEPRSVKPGYVLNPCIARGIETPGLYPSLRAMDKACHLPGTKAASSHPVPPPRLPRWNGPNGPNAGAHAHSHRRRDPASPDCARHASPYGGRQLTEKRDPAAAAARSDAFRVMSELTGEALIAETERCGELTGGCSGSSNGSSPRGGRQQVVCELAAGLR